MSYRTISLLVVVCFLIATESGATRPYVDYRCLYAQASMVVVADVQSVSGKAVLVDAFGSLYPVTFQVTKVVKGAVMVNGEPSKLFQMLLRLDNAEIARPKSGDQFLMFVKNHEAGPYLLNGAQSMRQVHGGKIEADGKRIPIRDFEKFMQSKAKAYLCANSRQ